MAGSQDTQYISFAGMTPSVEPRTYSAKEVLNKVYEALKEKGYDPVTQIVGYLISEDPTYITNYQGARSLVLKVERDELLQELVSHYLEPENKGK